MSDNLPGDVLSDILARLPAEDLVPCTSVCKKWYSLIRNPNFISLHLKKSGEDEQRNHLLFRYFTENPNREHYSLRFDSTFKRFKKLKFPFATDMYFGVVGSCNGLVCIADDQWGYRHVAFIWNPMIRKAVSVPRPNVTYNSHGSFMHSLGFGFDSLTNDYKIVRITHLYYEIIPPEVEVYTLNTGCWRTINDKAPPFMVEERSQQAYVRGASHWLACTTRCYESRKNLILSFDMRDEVFGEIAVPDTVLCVGDKICLFEYEESIALFHNDNGIQNPCCTMWMMKEYGEPESWVKQFTVDLTGGLGRSVGMRSNGEVIFGKNDGGLVSYTYKDKKFSKLPIRKSKVPNWSVFFVGKYTNSLVLLDKGAEFYDAAVYEKYGWGWEVAKDEEDDYDDDNDDVEYDPMRRYMMWFSMQNVAEEPVEGEDGEGLMYGGNHEV